MSFPKLWFAQSKMSRRLSALLKPAARARRKATASVFPVSAMSESLESRTLLTVSFVDITALRSTADTDGALDVHVTVPEGTDEMMDVFFAYAANRSGTATVSILNAAGESMNVGNSLGTSAGKFLFGTRLDLSTLPAGTYDLQLVLIDLDGGAGREDFVRGAIEVTSSVIEVGTTTSVRGGVFPYDGIPHGATDAVTLTDDGHGFGPNLSYDGNLSDGTPYGPTDAAPTDPGFYTVTASFDGFFDGRTRYLPSSASDQIIIEAPITEIETTTSVTGGTFTYDGNAHAATNPFTTGTDGFHAVPTLSYSGLLSDGVTVYGPTATAPTDAGSYTVTASFDGFDIYLASSASAAITINKASSSVTVSGATFTYDGTTHTGGSAVVNGAGVVTGGAVLSYSGDQVNAGTYTVTATYAGDANHEGSSASATCTIHAAALTVDAGTQGTINIAKAGVITFHLKIMDGLVASNSDIAALFNGATFTIGTDGGTAYTLTATATVDLDGSILIKMSIDQGLQNDLLACLAAGSRVNFNLSAFSNDGNYSIDADAVSRLINQGKLKFATT